jgi:hypothetical protein
VTGFERRAVAAAIAAIGLALAALITDFSGLETRSVVLVNPCPVVASGSNAGGQWKLQLCATSARAAHLAGQP